MASVIKITLINGKIREFNIAGSVNYKEIIENNSVMFTSNETETLIPLSSILTFEVTKQE